MAMTRRLAGVASPLAAEAEALRAGVQMIQTVTQGHVILESDSAEVVSLWSNRRNQRSSFTPIFNDIQEIVSSFASFCIVHVRRSANKAAHECARFASASAFEVWANVAPSFLLPVLQTDCNLSKD
jgi:ribonuclease HI